jgi:hypothetical protein
VPFLIENKITLSKQNKSVLRHYKKLLQTEQRIKNEITKSGHILEQADPRKRLAKAMARFTLLGQDANAAKVVLRFAGPDIVAAYRRNDALGAFARRVVNLAPRTARVYFQRSPGGLPSGVGFKPRVVGPRSGASQPGSTMIDDTMPAGSINPFDDTIPGASPTVIDDTLPGLGSTQRLPNVADDTVDDILAPRPAGTNRTLIPPPRPRPTPRPTAAGAADDTIPDGLPGGLVPDSASTIIDDTVVGGFSGEALKQPLINIGTAGGILTGLNALGTGWLYYKMHTGQEPPGVPAPPGVKEKEAEITRSGAEDDDCPDGCYIGENNPISFRRMVRSLRRLGFLKASDEEHKKSFYDFEREQDALTAKWNEKRMSNADGVGPKVPLATGGGIPGQNDPCHCSEDLKQAIFNFETFLDKRLEFKDPDGIFDAETAITAIQLGLMVSDETASRSRGSSRDVIPQGNLPPGEKPKWCNKPNLKPAEQTICATPELWAYESMNLKLCRKTNCLSDRPSLRQFIVQRNKCGQNVECIKRTYTQRLRALGFEGAKITPSAREFTSTSPVSPTSDRKVSGRGSAGCLTRDNGHYKSVGDLQKDLKTILGNKMTSPIDNKCGSKTRDAIRQVQALVFPAQPGEIDGIVGPKTAPRMKKLIQQRFLAAQKASTPTPSPSGEGLGSNIIVTGPDGQALMRSGDRFVPAAGPIRESLSVQEIKKRFKKLLN